MLAVHVKQALRTRALVKIVDVLRDQQHVAAPFAIEPCKRAVSGVGLDFGEARTASVVEAVNRCRIALECFGCRDVLDAMAFP